MDKIIKLAPTPMHVPTAQEIRSAKIARITNALLYTNDPAQREKLESERAALIRESHGYTEGK